MFDVLSPNLLSFKHLFKFDPHQLSSCAGLHLGYNAREDLITLVLKVCKNSGFEEDLTKKP